MKTSTQIIVLALVLTTQLPQTASAEQIAVSTATIEAADTRCKPCRDPQSKAPIPCSGADAGIRLDDGTVYREDLPPSSERSAPIGGAMPGSNLAKTPLAPVADAARANLPQPSTTQPTPLPEPPPVVLPAALPQPRTTVRIGDTPAGSLFASGKDQLTPAAIKQLNVLADQLRGKSGLRIETVGHTDNVAIGKGEAGRKFGSNQRLSEARAAAVARTLQQALGLPDSAIATSGRGETEPIADNATPQGRTRNRRTEISLWYDDQVAVAATVVPPPIQTVAPAPMKPVPAPAVKATVPPLAVPSPPSPPVSIGCGDIGPADRNNLPFRITVDGQTLATDTLMPEADRQRCVDVALDRTDIELRYDPLQTKPALNVWILTDGVVRGEPVSFGAYSNYGAWLQGAEVRLFRQSDTIQGLPLAVVPIQLDRPMPWIAPADAPAEMQFVLRVYDKQGRFDETAAKPLRLLDKHRPAADLDKPEREALTGWGQDSRTLANIPVAGGTITVNGSGIHPNQTVRALGQSVPVDPTGRFAMRQILPAGPQTVSVEVTDPDGKGTRFSRNLTLPDQDWFYVAIGDLTVGQNSVNGPAQLVNAEAGEYDGRVYTEGRGAFYLKGKVKGDWLLTASADTREQPVEDLFSNFNNKDPRYLLRNIDPNAYYPVYGDDSSLVEDAPTEGKFYVRLEKGDSHLMWGNFQTSWSGTELLQFSRGLYGANLRFRSEDTTKYGEKRTLVDGFASQPGTVAAREEFRGTGGSLFYLRHQDLTQGSERVWIEVRDKDSGLVLERRQLAAAQDFDLNYLQGRVMLREPLPSTAAGAGLIATSANSGNPLYLIATYEYAPGLLATKNMATGGRVSQWLGDFLQLGMTGYHQDDESAAQTLAGVDGTIRYRPGTFLRGEAAQSKGSGNGAEASLDGGFAFNPLASGGEKAIAYRVDGALDLAEVTNHEQGKISAYLQKKERGFSAPGQLSSGGEATEEEGVKATIQITAGTEAEVKGDLARTDSLSRNNAELVVRQKLSSEWGVSAGLRRDERDNLLPNASPTLSQNGERTDGQLRLDYKPEQEALPAGGKKNWEAYGFLQGTLSRTGAREENNRAGLGGATQLTDRLKLLGELSEGSMGPGGRLGIDYRLSDRSNTYLTYQLESESPDASWRGSRGTWVGGNTTKVNDQLRVFGESRLTHGAGPQSLTNAFGLDLSPNDRWTYGAKFEYGELADPLGGDLIRKALGLSTSYKFEKTNYRGNLECRDDMGNLVGHRVTWLMRNALSYQATKEWRLLGNFNFSISSNSQGAFYDGDFHEIVAAAAYRPTSNDRWNTLFKYTNFYNLPSPGQLNPSLAVADYAQKSHVVALDTIYDLWPWLSVGSKYAHRISELKATKEGGDWFDSSADLVIFRTDLHLLKKWDMVGEWRNLWASEAKDSRSGVLLALYRHFPKGIKLGVGYNFTNYSDDLTDLSYRSQGWFVNLVGTM